MSNFFIYILASRSRRLYTGVTNNLERRIFEHKSKTIPGFTRKYNIIRLVYFEVFTDIRQAIRREKQIKGWRRNRKIGLIQSTNPGWADLSDGWFGAHE
jgi:putative endonuclease